MNQHAFELVTLYPRPFDFQEAYDAFLEECATGASGIGAQALMCFEFALDLFAVPDVTIFRGIGNLSVIISMEPLT